MGFLEKLFGIKEEPLTPVDEAFVKVSSETCYFGQHEKACMILDKFSVPALGEECAFKFLVHTVSFVYFPRSIRTAYIGKAERYLEELLFLSGDHELHMDEIAEIRGMTENGATLESVRTAYRKIPA